jgi:hypothetical protein
MQEAPTYDFRTASAKNAIEARPRIPILATVIACIRGSIDRAIPAIAAPKLATNTNGPARDTEANKDFPGAVGRRLGIGRVESSGATDP